MSEVLDVSKKHLAFDGLTIKYSQDDGEEFIYKDYKNIKTYDNYERLLKDWTALKNIDKPSNAYTELLPIEEDLLDNETMELENTENITFNDFNEE